MNMENGSQPLIRLDNVSKVFVTDEVETHALSSRSFRRQERRVPVDCGTVRLREIDAAGDPGPARHAQRRHVLPERQAGDGAQAVRTGAHPQPRDRLYFPGVQPNRRPHGLRERGTAADLSRHALGGAEAAGTGGARAGGDVASHEALPLAALGRPAAACGRGARAERRSADPAGRRAYRQPGFGQRRGGDEPAPGTARGRARRSAW